MSSSDQWHRDYNSTWHDVEANRYKTGSATGGSTRIKALTTRIVVLKIVKHAVRGRVEPDTDCFASRARHGSDIIGVARSHREGSIICDDFGRCRKCGRLRSGSVEHREFEHAVAAEGECGCFECGLSWEEEFNRAGLALG